MTYTARKDFLEALRNALEKYGVPDINDIISDFERHFSDGEAAGETEAQVCEKLGDPEEIAGQYIEEDDGEAQRPKVELKKENKVSLEKPGSKKEDDETGAQDTQDSSAYTGADGQTYQYSTAYSGAGGQYYQNSSSYSGTNGQTYQTSGGYYDNSQGYRNSGNYYGSSQTYQTGSGTCDADIGAVIGVLCLDVFVLSWAVPTLASLIIALGGTAVSFVASGLAVTVFGAFSGAVEFGGFVVTGFAPISCIFLGIGMAALGGMLVIAAIAAVRGFINMVIGIINMHAKAFVGHKVLNKIGKKHKNKEEI